MKKSFALIVVVLFSQIGCDNQTSPFAVTSVETYLNQMIDFMENNHLNRKSIDWADFRTKVQINGASALTISQANETIKYAFELLNDDISFLVTASGVVLSNSVVCEATKPGAITKYQDIGYIKIPPYTGSGVAAAVFAEKMHGEIRDQDNANLKGWVIDLRENIGGNLWPMITGIGPILGDGVAGFFVDSNAEQNPFGYNSGSSTFKNEPVVTVAFPYSLLFSNSTKIAILTDNSTSNAGEAVAVAFSARNMTRSFGSATCGRGGGTESYRLSDGSFLYLTTSFLIDRDQVSKQGPLIPNEIISDPALIYDKAVEWIYQ